MILRNATFVNRVLAVPRTVKQGLVLASDIVMCVLSLALAFYLRLGEWVPVDAEPLLPTVVTIALAIPLFIAFGLYRAIFRYSGTSTLAPLALAIGAYAAIFSLVLQSKSVWEP